MNKGIFSSLVAVTAIVLIGAIILTTSANVKSSGNTDFSEKILEIKKEWNNARYLMDKAASDALADTVDTGICSFSLDSAKIEKYQADALANSIQDCSFGSGSFSAVPMPVPPNSYEITVALACSKKISSDFEIKNFEKTVVFNKKIESQTDVPEPGDCTITVTDLQSGLIEVQKKV
jgi:hypothetical protein